MNQGSFAGNVGKDAVLRATQGGTSVAGFSLAVSTGYGQNKQTLWVSCSLWGKAAEGLAQYITKGTKVAVSGEITLKTWESQSGTKTDLHCDVKQITLLGFGQSNQEQTPAQQSGSNEFQPGPDLADDDIPF